MVENTRQAAKEPAPGADAVNALGLTGYAEVYRGRWADAAVALRHRGHGIGTALAGWTQRLSRRDGKGLVGMPVPEGSAGERLLQALGYEVLWTS